MPGQRALGNNLLVASAINRLRGEMLIPKHGSQVDAITWVIRQLPALRCGGLPAAQGPRL